MKIRKIISILTMPIIMCSLISCADTSKKSDAGNEIKSVTSISDVYEAGEQVSAVAVEYSENIDSSSVSTDDFKVDGRDIESVYVNDKAEKNKDSSASSEGNYVIVELKEKEESDMPGGNGGMHGDKNGMDKGQKPDGNFNGGPDGNSDGGPDGNFNGGPDGKSKESSNSSSKESEIGSICYSVPDTGNGAGGFTKLPDTSVSITQSGDIKTESGSVICGNNESMDNTASIQNIVDDFVQFTYKDPENGVVLGYNLYIPKNYDSSKSYPLVTFIHDASVTGSDPKITLTQGNGATVWASEEEQAKHECFVLAPQYEYQITNDNFEASEALDTTVKLINSLTQQYSININKLYLTGQSMGCMSSLYLNTKYPDMFAASLLVAGQWDTSKLAGLSNKNLWIVVSEGDSKAFPAMNEATKLWESEGAVINSTELDAKEDADTINKKAEEVKNMNGNIKYTTLKLGSTLSDSSSGGNEHTTTWKTIGYTIEPSHDWLFEQSK